MRGLYCGLKVFLFMTLLVGVLYPAIVTLIAQLAFHRAANGSLVETEGKVIGSVLIAQKNDDPKYFWARPSAINYNPIPSGGSNLGPTSRKLKEQVEKRLKRYDVPPEAVPTELVYASGSGLDPHLSLKAAYFQAGRIAKARSVDASQIQSLIEQLAEGRQWGFLGPRYINVLKLNEALDKLHPQPKNE